MTTKQELEKLGVNLKIVGGKRRLRGMNSTFRGYDLKRLPIHERIVIEIKAHEAYKRRLPK